MFNGRAFSRKQFLFIVCILVKNNHTTVCDLNTWAY